MSWPVVPLKRLVSTSRPITYGIVQAGDEVPGGIPYIRPVDMTDSDGVVDDVLLPRTSYEIAAAYQRSALEPGDLVVSIGPSFGKVMIVPAPLRGANLTQGTARVAAGSGINNRFLYWALQAQTVKAHWGAAVGGATFRALNLGPLCETPISVPPPDEQRRVADFLDDACSRLSMLVAYRGRQDALLAEAERSSSESHLEVLLLDAARTRLKYLVRERDDRLLQREAPTLLSVSIHKGVVPRASLTDKEPRADDLALYKCCEPEDLVLNRMRAFQGGIGIAPMFGIVSPDYTVMRAGQGVLPEYLHYLMRSPWFVGQMTRRLRGVGGVDQGNVRTPRVNFADLGLIRVPSPSIEAQRVSVHDIRAEANHLQSLRALVTRQVERLSEHRVALITAAVTGQLDVTTARGAA